MTTGSDIRPVFTEEVKTPIDEETKLVASIAATIFSNGIEIELAVRDAFKIIDFVIANQNGRWEQRIAAEQRRRKGY